MPQTKRANHAVQIDSARDTEDHHAQNLWRKGVAYGRCWCVPHWALNPIRNAERVFFYFGITALTAVTVFQVLVLVENLLQSHNFAV